MKISREKISKGRYIVKVDNQIIGGVIIRAFERYTVQYRGIVICRCDTLGDSQEELINHHNKVLSTSPRL